MGQEQQMTGLTDPGDRPTRSQTGLSSHSHLVCGRLLLAQLRIVEATIIVPLILLNFYTCVIHRVELEPQPWKHIISPMAMNPRPSPHPPSPSALIFLEQQNAGGRQPRVQDRRGDLGQEVEMQPASSSRHLPLLHTGLPKEQSNYADQQDNHDSPYDAWQGLIIIVSRWICFPHTERIKKVNANRTWDTRCWGKIQKNKWRGLKLKRKGKGSIINSRSWASAWCQGHWDKQYRSPWGRWRKYQSLPARETAVQYKLTPCTLVFMEGLPEEVMHKLHLWGRSRSLPEIQAGHSFPERRHSYVKSVALRVAIIPDQQAGEGQDKDKQGDDDQREESLYPEGLMGHAECWTLSETPEWNKGKGIMRF